MTTSAEFGDTPIRGEGRLTGRPSRRAGTVLIATGVALLAAAPPALAQTTGHGGHGVPFTATGPEWLAVALRAVVFTAGAVVAGAGLVRFWSGPPGERSTRFLFGAAVLATLALGLSVPTLGTGVLLAVGQGTLTLLVPVLLRRAGAGFAAGAALGVLLAWEAATATTGWALATGWVHTLSGAVWLGAAVLVVAGEPGTRRELLRRLGPPAGVAALVVLASGLVGAWQAQLRPDLTSAQSLFGQLVALETVLVLAVAWLGLRAYRRLAGPAPEPAHRRPDAVAATHRTPAGSRALFTGRLHRFAGPRALERLGQVGVVALAAALLTGVSLPALAPPVAPAEAGQLLVRTVALGERSTAVVVAPHRPGPNLVHISAAGVRVGTDPAHLVPATARPGTAGSWAVVDLPEGRSRLWVDDGTTRVPLRIEPVGDPAPASLTGPDGPECLTAALGGFLGAGGAPGCPADGLSAADAQTLRATVDFLGGRGMSLHPVGDGSPRAAAAMAEVRAVADARGVRVDEIGDPASAVLVLGGWEQADRLVTAHAQGLAAPGGVYLAPWLATAPLLGHGTGAISALSFDPRGTSSQRYLAALRSESVPALASPAGLAAWQGGDAATPTRLYASAQVAFLPPELGHAHGDEQGWIPGGTMTAVTGPLQAP